MPDKALPDDSMTLGAARRELRPLAKNGGGRCRVCKQWSQEYRWSLYATAVRLLARMHAAGGTTEFVEVRKIKEKGQGGDGTRLRHWGLAEQESARRPDGGKSGWWRCTELGEQFLHYEVSVPKYAYVYDGTCLRLAGPPFTVKDALGIEFDYEEFVRP